MNNAQLINELAKRLNKSKTEVTGLLEYTTGIIAEQIKLSNTVSIHNFGTLELKKKEKRVCVNPGTGIRSITPAKLAVHYKVSPTLKEKLKNSGA